MEKLGQSFNKLIKRLGSFGIGQWIALVVLLFVAVWAFRKLKAQAKSGFKKVFGSGDDDTINVPITDARKAVLKELVKDMHELIYSYVWSVDQAMIDKFYVLPDNELVFTAKYYKEQYGVTLYYDLDEEWLAGTDDEKLLQRLEALGYNT